VIFLNPTRVQSVLLYTPWKCLASVGIDTWPTQTQNTLWSVCAS